VVLEQQVILELTVILVQEQRLVLPVIPVVQVLQVILELQALLVIIEL
jgi:hypothetical protein